MDRGMHSVYSGTVVLRLKRQVCPIAEQKSIHRGLEGVKWSFDLDMQKWEAWRGCTKKRSSKYIRCWKKNESQAADPSDGCDDC